MGRIQTRCEGYRQELQDTDKMGMIIHTRYAGYRQDVPDTHKMCRVLTRYADKRWLFSF